MTSAAGATGSDGTPVAGQQFEYGFDDIGNRTSTAAGGDGSGTGLRAASYTPNRLNQYTSRTVPGAVDILGVANPTAAVTVNGVSADRKGEYFRRELGVTNASAPGLARGPSSRNTAVARPTPGPSWCLGPPKASPTTRTAT